MKPALIDVDFLIHLCESDLSEADITENVKKAFDCMELLVNMHDLMYCKELVIDNMSPPIREKVDAFFKQNIICVSLLEDIISDSNKKAYYETIFREIYPEVFNYPISDLPVKDIFCDWKGSASLGETHMLCMCIVNGIDLVLSEDSDTRKLAKSVNGKYLYYVDVWDRKTLFQKAVSKCPGLIRKEMRRSLCHTG